MSKVLLLNATYQPLKLVSLQRAVGLMLGGKVETVEGIARVLKTPTSTFTVPSVIRLRHYVNVPHRTLRWSKWRVLQRDNYTCGYCGRYDLPRSEYTVDHIIPTSRGGKKVSWGNTICACFSCNQRKGDQTPTEAGMKLLFEPKTPRTNYLVASGNTPVEWKKYLEV